MCWYQPQQQQKQQKIVCTICSPCCFLPPSSWSSFDRFVALWICRLVGLLKRFVTIYHAVSLFFFLRRRAHSFHFGILPRCAHVINPWNWTRQMCVCGAFRRESIKIRWAHTPQIVCSRSVDARAQLLSLVTQKKLVYCEPDLVYYLCWVFCMCISCNSFGSYFSLLLGCKLSMNYIHTYTLNVENDITLRYNQRDNYTLFAVRVCHVIPSSVALVAAADLVVSAIVSLMRLKNRSNTHRQQTPKSDKDYVGGKFCVAIIRKAINYIGKWNESRQKKNVLIYALFWPQRIFVINFTAHCHTLLIIIKMITKIAYGLLDALFTTLFVSIFYILLLEIGGKNHTNKIVPHSAVVFFVGETSLCLQYRASIRLCFWVDTQKVKQKPTEFESKRIVNCELLMHTCIAL